MARCLLCEFVAFGPRAVDSLLFSLTSHSCTSQKWIGRPKHENVKLNFDGGLYINPTQTNVAAR